MNFSTDLPMYEWYCLKMFSLKKILCKSQVTLKAPVPIRSQKLSSDEIALFTWVTTEEEKVL